MRKSVISVVDDEPVIRSVVKGILNQKGFETIEAGDGIEGFNVVQEFGENITLLLTDVRMPRMDGISLKMVTVIVSTDACPIHLGLF